MQKNESGTNRPKDFETEVLLALEKYIEWLEAGTLPAYTSPLTGDLKASLLSQLKKN